MTITTPTTTVAHKKPSVPSRKTEKEETGGCSDIYPTNILYIIIFKMSIVICRFLRIISARKICRKENYTLRGIIINCPYAFKFGKLTPPSFVNKLLYSPAFIVQENRTFKIFVYELIPYFRFLLSTVLSFLSSLFLSSILRRVR